MTLRFRIQGFRVKAGYEAGAPSRGFLEVGPMELPSQERRTYGSYITRVKPH